MSTHEAPQNAGRRWGRTWGVALGAALGLAILATAFVWPAVSNEPDGLSVAITGDAEAVSAFTQSTADSLGEIVEITAVDDRDAAVVGIEDRSFIGALVLGENPEVLIASASGQVPTAFMNQIAGQLQANIDGAIYVGVTDGIRAMLAAQGPPPAGAPDGNPAAAAMNNFPESLPTVAVTDIVPYADGDPSGTGITSAGIPLTVGSLLASILIAFSVAGRWQRASAVLCLGIGGGLALTLLLGTWLEAFPGPFGLVWLALSLSVTATSALFVGLHSVMGRAGLGIAAAVTLLAAMPLAAFAVPYQFLPGGLGSFGQGLIPGATSSLARSVSYFPEAATAAHWWTLAAWAAAGLLLVFIARTAKRPPVAPAPARPVPA